MIRLLFPILCAALLGICTPVVLDSWYVPAGSVAAITGVVGYMGALTGELILSLWNRQRRAVLVDLQMHRRLANSARG